MSFRPYLEPRIVFVDLNHRFIVFQADYFTDEVFFAYFHQVKEPRVAQSLGTDNGT